MSTVAVFAALAGGAYAAAKIGTTDIQAKAVTSKKLARAAVTRAKLADRAVTSSKLAAPIDGAALGVGSSISMAVCAGGADRSGNQS